VLKFGLYMGQAFAHSFHVINAPTFSQIYFSKSSMKENSAYEVLKYKFLIFPRISWLFLSNVDIKGPEPSDRLMIEQANVLIL